MRPGARAVKTIFALLALSLSSGADLRVHGFASYDGPALAGFNLSLSCHRANKIADHHQSRSDSNVRAEAFVGRRQF